LKFGFFSAIIYGRVVWMNGYDSLTHFLWGGGGLFSLPTFCNKYDVSDVRAPLIFSQRST